MVRVFGFVAILLASTWPVVSWADDPHVGPTPDGSGGGGGMIVPTRQLIRPAGKSVEYKGRPVDLVVAPDGQTVYVKSSTQLLALDAASWTIRQELKLPAKTGASLHGIAVSTDSSHVYLTASGSNVLEAAAGADGNLTWSRQIHVGKSGAKHETYPCGLELMAGNRALVCLSLSNSVAIVKLDDGSTEAEIPVGVAPFDVVVDSQGKIAYVSNWGGRRAQAGDKTADSAGTKVVVDDRGAASTGTVGVIDLAAQKQIAQIPVGLHPSDLLLSAGGKTLYVANANSDTISVIDTAARTVKSTISIRPDEQLPFGSMPNALALVGEKLFVADGGNNAIAVVDLPRKTPAGFIPAGWYPGGLASDGKNLYITNVKGTGSRTATAENKFNSHGFSGTVTKVAIPSSADELAKMTAQVRTDALVPQTLAAFEKAQSGVKPVPVPQHAGEPSVFEHVVYVIKENRTYDQLFGDLPRGNNDSKLCIFGRSATPNQHALAEQFALLDNYYCNGVCSADGHAWATEGIAVDYLEKSFGDWVRSYPFSGDDALAIAPTGFIWDNVLLHGLSFRDFGEMFSGTPTPLTSWANVYNDWKNKTHQIKFKHETTIEALKRFSCPDSPGWSLRVTDQIRADAFLKEFAAAEKTGRWPNLVTLYLPDDHTNGTNAGAPTPAAMVADNDLAVGRCVEAISKSRFWPKTCIFVIEDDPQAGFDHVDGHRSICLAISPYTRRGQTVSAFYNQTSVLHTIELMLGLPPMNQLDAMSPVMRECFSDQADLRPYACLPNETPLDQMNPQKAALRGGDAIKLAEKSERLNFDEPDRADEDTLNRVIWHSVKGMRVPYPDAWAGAHGRGLRKLHLKLDQTVVDDED